MRLFPAALVASVALGVVVLDTAFACPATALNAVFIGNSYSGGRSVGRACLVDEDRPECENKAIPGNVRGFSTVTYPGEYDVPPDLDTLVDPNGPYNPITNPHLGDVPSKIKLLVEHICGSSVFEYVQNTQSSMTTRTHAGQASVNPQNGTIKILEGENTANSPQYHVVVIQPQSTEYLDGATSSRVSALEELMKSRGAAAATTNVRFILQQTWPRRDATTYNQICTTRGRNKQTGMLQEIDDTILGLSQQVSTPFEVSPTGSAFVEFAKLACSGILPSGECAFDNTVACPIWFGETGKISLYDEEVGEEGSHQSDEIGAWLSAAVMSGMLVQSDTPCFVSETDLQDVMPAISNLASIPTGQSIYSLISHAARLALEDSYGSLTECTSDGGTVTPAPSESAVSSSDPSSAPSDMPNPSEALMPSIQPSAAPSATPAIACGQRGQICCSGSDPCESGRSCKPNGKC